MRGYPGQYLHQFKVQSCRSRQALCKDSRHFIPEIARITLPLREDLKSSQKIFPFLGNKSTISFQYTFSLPSPTFERPSPTIPFVITS